MPFLIGSRQACPVTGYCKGGFAALSPLALSAGDELYRAYQTAEDDRDWTYLFCERPQTREDFQRYLRLRRPALTETRWWWSIRRTDAPWGPALLRIDPANGVAELGTINWSPLMRRSALGSEAIFLMLRHLFDDLGYRRCEWKCDSLNLPSRRPPSAWVSVTKALSAAVVVKDARATPIGCRSSTRNGRRDTPPLPPAVAG